jgi:hypothetical protein
LHRVPAVHAETDRLVCMEEIYFALTGSSAHARGNYPAFAPILAPPTLAPPTSAPPTSAPPTLAPPASPTTSAKVPALTAATAFAHDGALVAASLLRTAFLRSAVPFPQARLRLCGTASGMSITRSRTGAARLLARLTASCGRHVECLFVPCTQTSGDWRHLDASYSFHLMEKVISLACPCLRKHYG